MTFFDEFNKTFGGSNNIFGNLVSAFSDLNIQVTKVNKELLLNRDRVLDISSVIADAAPKIIRLGGSVEDTVRTIAEAAQGLNRTVIIAADDVSRLYAASNLIDQSVESIVTNFSDVGMQVSNMSNRIEESINYVQSIGGNAKEVMREVTSQMELMNKFNFQDGVMGFTKMAAQASMLKLEMRTVSAFAEKLYDPQQAIETASAFQRLGVAAGTMVDPFSLMYKSINDPEGLQDGIIELTRKFVEFNNETGDFKINPAGILQMRELSSVIGMSYNEFAKTALAAADLDKRISEISFDYSGDREDLMLLANMAQFKGGKYVVQIENREKDLSDVTVEEFEKLRKLQQDTPKTLEDINRAQNTIMENIKNDVAAIARKLLYGVSSTPEIQNLIEGFRLGEDFLGKTAFNATPEAKELRAVATQAIDAIKKTSQGLYDSFSGEVLSDERIDEITKSSDDLIRVLENTMKTSLTRGYDTAVTELKTNKNLESGLSDYVLKTLENNRETFEKLNLIYKDKGKEIETKTTEKIIKTDNDVKFSGELRHKIDVPVGIDDGDLKKILNNTFNSDSFKTKIFQILDTYGNNKNPEKG